MVTSLTYTELLHDETEIEVGNSVADAGVKDAGVEKDNWGKRVSVGEPMGVSVGCEGVKVEAVCMATSVLAASVA